MPLGDFLAGRHSGSHRRVSEGRESSRKKADTVHSFPETRRVEETERGWATTTGRTTARPRRRLGGSERPLTCLIEKATAGWPAEPRDGRPPLSLGLPITPTQLFQMQPENVAGQSANLSLDSITLGQLRSMVGSAPKPKVPVAQTLESNLTCATK